jgi:hypothetical protein
VRLVANSETLSEAEAMVRSFTSAGAQAHIHRVPDGAVAINRQAQYSTEMAPGEALTAYLEKKDVPEEQRPAIVSAFADVAAACQH